MVHSSARAHDSARRAHAFLLTSLAAMIICLCATAARGQMGGIDSDPGDPGTGGKNIIQGNIYYDNGRRLDRRVKVRLRGLDTDNFTMSDDSGAFSFRRLRDGTYTVMVDAGGQFEIASENVDIIQPMRRRGDIGQTYTVQLTLHARKAASQPPPGTVDASAGGIPEPARKLYKEALDSIQAGDYKKAIEQLNEAVKLYPMFVAALNELGLQYMRQKEFDKAEAALREAVKLAPDGFQPQLNFGILMMQKKDYVTAATALERAVQKDSASALAHLYLGKAYINLGVYNKAEKELLQVVSIGGDNKVEAHRYLAAVYIETKNNERAVEELEQYLSLAPKAKDADKIREIVKQLRAQK
ncbi:MAG TPA: tetratricopeptide repeat protein [Blastocatellia bacterium]|nr:tetratricopeptide repeat protein [Blastocatellia bacterium]